MKLTAKYVRSILDYDADTGVFRWKWRDDARQSVNAQMAGKIAGCIMPDGYITIGINRRYYKAHRLAWLHVNGEWPDVQIDHINGIRSDNRIANLREATVAENKWNSRPSVKNTSGVKGVSLDKRSGKWKVSICVNGAKIHLGYFSDFEQAKHVRLCADKEHFGEFSWSA